MKCPFCGHPDTQVIDSRVNDTGDTIRRRRRCTACEKRFTTFETADIRLPQVVKELVPETFAPVRALHQPGDVGETTLPPILRVP